MALPVKFSAKAQGHLRSLHRYISQDSTPLKAEAFVRDIVSRCQRIALVPFQGARRLDVHPRARQTGYKQRVSILFRVDEHQIVILAIAYGGKRI